MAKGQMRRSREQKKPKKQRAEIVATPSVFTNSPVRAKPAQYAKRPK